MPTNATDLREYRRGAPPGDFYQIYGQAEAWPIRSVDGDPLRDGWVAVLAGATEAVLAWTPADAEAGRANQETLQRILIPGDAICRAGALRASGTLLSPSYLRAKLDPSTGALSIEQVLAGAVSVLGGTTVAGLRSWAVWWLRLRASGSVATARLWPEGAAEPGTWQVTTTTALTDGSLGIGRPAGALAAEVYFLSYGTNGDTAPGPDSIPPGMATWALDPDAQVEVTAELETLDPLAGTARSFLWSSLGRFTDFRDWPPSAEMPAALEDPGGLTLKLTTDVLFGAELVAGQAQGSQAAAVIRNTLNGLTELLDLTAAGRPFVVRAGLARWRSHRYFEPVYAAKVDGEPAVDDKVQIGLQEPYRTLQPNLKARRYVGIPGCVVLSGAGHQIPHVVAYDITRFLLAFRFRAPSSTHTFGLSKRTSLAAEGFALLIEATTGAVVGRASVGGVASALYLRSPLGYADGAFHSCALGVDADQLAYLVVDGVPVAQVGPPGLVDLPGAAISLEGFGGESIFDVRLYNYCPDVQEVQGMLAQRAADDDPGAVGLWPCDDVSGSTATDYSPTGNSIVFAGTAGVNYAFTPTDLGEPEQAGTPMQIVAGAAFNAQALLVDRNLQRFRLADGALPGVLTVRGQGAVTTSWTDQGDGVIEFPSVVGEPVTFDQGPDLAGDHAHLRLGAVIEELMTERMGLAENGGYDPLSIPALNAIAPFDVAFLAASDTAGAAALDALLAPIGGHYKLDRDGRVVPGFILPPVSPGPVAGDAVLELLGTEGRSRVAWSSTTGDLPSGAFTLSFWVKSYSIDRWEVLGDDGDPFPSYGAIANCISPANGGYYVGFYRASQGSIGFRIPWLSGAYFVTPPGAVRWGMWTFIACRFTGTTLSIWAGTHGSMMRKVYEAPTTGTPFAAAQGLELGGRLTTAAPGSLAGSVCQYTVRNVALADADLQSLMATGGAPTLPDATVTFYAPVNDGAGAHVLDLISGTYGRVYGARWAPRLVLDMRAGLSMSKLRVKRLRPAWDAVAAYGLNQHPLADTDFAGGVGAADRALLKRPVRRAYSSSPQVQATYLDARELAAVDAPTLMVQADARQVARNLRYRFDPARLQAMLTDAPRAAAALALGDEVWIYHPRLPGGQGGAFRVVGITPSLKTLRPALDLWGNRIPAEQDILADDGRPIEADTGRPIIADD